MENRAAHLHQEFPKHPGLNPHKSSGPDHLPPPVLKECTIEIASNFCSLLNRSFFAGEVANAWKIANSVPVLERTC